MRISQPDNRMFDRLSVGRLTLPTFVIVLACLVNVTAAFGQAEIVEPATLGFDVEALNEIDDVMKAGLEDGKMIGCNAMILKDDKICYYKSWGQQDAEKDVPIARDTIFRIYSMSKPITSVAVMQLVEQGKLELDANVSEYVPEFADLKVLVADKEQENEFKEEPMKRQITVRDLLRHSSGLTYGFFGSSEVDKRYVKAGVLISDPDLKSMVGKLTKLPLKHQPGSRFEYSVSTDVLGYLVEVASKQSFDEYLSEQIFQPLSMDNTSFVVPEDKLVRFAELYRPARDGNLKPSSSRSSARMVDPENRFFSGGGGLCSTIDDYMQFSRMLLNGGQLDGKRLISGDSLSKMWTNQLDDLENKSDRFKFGLGFSISEEGDYSWGGAAGTRFWVNPDVNLAMVYMVQINPYRQRFGSQMRQIVYRALRD